MAAYLLLLLFVCVCLRSISTITKAELERFTHPPKADASLSFLVVGDWGRRGQYNQSLVALQMGKLGEKLDIDFVISTGDNFYHDGLNGVYDPQFEESFTQIYTSKSLNKQWYNVMGNHDYRGDVYAQLNPVLNMIDRRWVCRRSFIVNAETTDIFFVDTTPFVTEYFTHPKDHSYDWRGVIPRENYIANVLKDVESALKHSIANWKIVVGHHTMRSAGHHGDTKELIELLLPILEENNVDFYVNGHDHSLQHLTKDGSHIQYLTSGGGSKAWKGDFKMDQGGVEFYYDGQGFMSVQLTPSNADIKFYDVFGKVLHRLNLSKQLYTM